MKTYEKVSSSERVTTVATPTQTYLQLFFHIFPWRGRKKNTIPAEDMFASSVKTSLIETVHKN